MYVCACVCVCACPHLMTKTRTVMKASTGGTYPSTVIHVVVMAGLMHTGNGRLVPNILAIKSTYTRATTSCDFHVTKVSLTFM